MSWPPRSGSKGVLQPIVVRYDEPRDTYVVIHGERRWRAARMAGLDRLPAVVREVPPERRLIQQLMENIVRDDLNAVDRAAALRALKAQLGDVPWEEVAGAVGIRRSRLFQLLGTEKLPEQIQDDIRSGTPEREAEPGFPGVTARRPGSAPGWLSWRTVSRPAESERLAKALRGRDLPDDPQSITAMVRELRSASDRPDMQEPKQVTGAQRRSLARPAIAVAQTGFPTTTSIACSGLSPPLRPEGSVSATCCATPPMCWPPRDTIRGGCAKRCCAGQDPFPGA